MLTVLINGSPKATHSASAALLADLKKYLLGKTEIADLSFHSSFINPSAIETIQKADALVFAFPLYVDTVPSHLLHCLTQINLSHASVYAICNAGFYEGEQTALALRILKNWCAKNALLWKRGVGIGGGGAITSMSSVPSNKGPKKNIHLALSTLSADIINNTDGENIYTSIGLPRFFYQTAAETGWRQQAKKNGLSPKELSKKL